MVSDMDVNSVDVGLGVNIGVAVDFGVSDGSRLVLPSTLESTMVETWGRYFGMKVDIHGNISLISGM